MIIHIVYYVIIYIYIYKDIYVCLIGEIYYAWICMRSSVFTKKSRQGTKNLYLSLLVAD